MLADICYTLDWIQRKKAEIRATDAGILERVIHAFALLGHLKECGLDFVFKGGTSILLHTPGYTPIFD
jgi:stage V sporulation protein SpoVS